MRRKSLAVLVTQRTIIFALAFGVLFWVTVVSKQGQTVAPQDELKSTSALNHNTPIYVNYHIGEIVKRDGVDGAVALVMGMFNRKVIDMGGCHTLLHLVGHQAYGYFRGDMDRLARVDWRLCGGAYEHGVEAQIVDSSPDAIKDLRRFCEAMRRASTPGTPCYHGAGHAFMGRSLDVLGSLQGCDNLIEPTAKDLSECYKGVFSESAFRIQGVDGDTGLPISGSPPIALTSTGPLDICQSLPEKYQESCGLQLSRVVAGSDIENSLSECLKGSYAINLRAACVQNMSAIFAQRGLFQADIVLVPKVVHSLGSSLRRAYMRGALGEFRAFEQSGHAKDWTVFCKSFPAPDDQAYCKELPSTG